METLIIWVDQIFPRDLHTYIPRYQTYTCIKIKMYLNVFSILEEDIVSKVYQLVSTVLKVDCYKRIIIELLTQNTISHILLRDVIESVIVAPYTYM